MPRTLEILEPHGFCMGVKAAIETAFHALSSSMSAGGKIYCLHELVHNEAVVADLKTKGMCFVERLSDIPDGEDAAVLFSAHGVSPAVRAEAARRGLKTIDATCPFVARVHRQVRAYAQRGLAVVVIGHAEHVEVRGVADEARDAGARTCVVMTPEDVVALEMPREAPIGVVCQTTLASDVAEQVVVALRTKYATVETTPAAEVCTATRDRQNAVRNFVAQGGDGVLVLGSANSSNTRRLAEIAEQGGARAWRVGNMQDLAACDFPSVKRLGVTSGASTPESFFADALTFLQ